MEQIKLVILIFIFTLVSGFADAQGFFHASKMWEGKTLLWTEVAKSALGFGFGILTYWLAVKFLNEIGIISAEVQTTVWFGVTIVGVAVLSGTFANWQFVDKVIASVVLLGICWLLLRTRG